MSLGDGAGGAGAGADATAAVIATAKAWLVQDPDPETQAELLALISAGVDGSDGYDGGDTGTGDAAADAIADLHSRFDERLAFGTAGLRGEIAAGPNRMNRVLVSQAAAGLAAFLLARIAPGTTPSVVIGYDGRKNSHVFATDTAAIMAGAGVRAILLPRLLPTPVLAFAVRYLGTSAGVMVTASHNPPNDNGYKVYLGDSNEGSQIVSPDDAAISTEILRVAAEQVVPDLPRAAYEKAPESVVQAYIEATARIRIHRAHRSTRSIQRCTGSAGTPLAKCLRRPGSTCRPWSTPRSLRMPHSLQSHSPIPRNRARCTSPTRGQAGLVLS